MTWLLGIIETIGLNWLWKKFLSLIASQKSSDAQHDDDVSQTQEDTADLQKITPTSNAADVDKATDEALKHL